MTKYHPSPVQRAAALLADDARRFEQVSSADADAAVLVTARAIRARVARRRRMRVALGALAAAAAIAASVGATRLHRGPAPLARAVPPAPEAPAAVVESLRGSVLASNGGETSRVQEGRTARAGDRFIALQDASAALRLASGTVLGLEGGGDIAWLEQGSSQVFALSAGAVRADVAKLGPGERFVVRTQDAEVEVRGTSFRVASAPSDPSCGNGTATRVEVFEGVVTVRVGASETRVAAGKRWPSGCERPEPATPRETTSTRPSPAPAPARPTRPGAPAKVSDLAAQNDLFDEALAAERRGDPALALATLDRFLDRYPSSPLFENALAERMKVLAKTDRARARDAASTYLQRYPNGFARSDATALLAGAP